MSFLRYEKKFIEITDGQARMFADCLDRGKKIPLGIERLNPGKCEILKSLPSMDDKESTNIEVIYLQDHKQLESGVIDYTDKVRDFDTETKRTPEYQKEVANTLDNMRKELSKRHGFFKR